VTNQVQKPHITGKVGIFILIFAVNVLQIEKTLSFYPTYAFVNSDGLLVQCLACCVSYAEMIYPIFPLVMRILQLREEITQPTMK